MNTDMVLKYETGGLTLDEAVLLFTGLIETGEIWQLPTGYLDDAVKLLDLGQLPITKETMQ